MKTVQDIVSAIDGDKASHWWKVALFLIVMIGFMAFYATHEYKNYNNAESMDVAQLARNISNGRGYVTDNIRISSIELVKQQNGGAPLLENHPDIVNPPLYPVILAGIFKVTRPDFTVKENSVRYVPEIIITFFNQFLLLFAVWLTFLLGQKLFDREVGFFSGIILLFSDMMWKFSISGLPIILSIVLVLLLFNTLVNLRTRNISEKTVDVPGMKDENLPGLVWSVWTGGLIGLFLGLACLNQYALGWLFIPVFWFVAVVVKKGRKFVTMLPVLLVFVLLVAPWVYRNFLISGLPFGLATLAPCADTVRLSGNILERVSTPDIMVYYAPEQMEYLRKIHDNLSVILQNDLPKLGNSWLTIFFLSGIVLPFLKRGLNSTRFLLIISILLIALVQAVTRTHLSSDVPVYNSENLLVIFVPLVFIFGTAFFFTLIEEINYGIQILRALIVWSVAVILCIPMISTLTVHKSSVLAWPPYHPQTISHIGNFYGENEVITSDMPWAVAWYGQKKAIWLPLNPKEEFFKINDGVCVLKGLYLTQLTLDRLFLTDFNGSDKAWGEFVLRFFARKELIEKFPLRNAWADVLPQQIFLAEWERWRLSEIQKR